ncbi:hypothetical protein [Brevibacillus daliensis]|nr:hypothetical protein [Brevibacillus daliensis]
MTGKINSQDDHRTDEEEIRQKAMKLIDCWLQQLHDKDHSDDTA